MDFFEHMSREKRRRRPKAVVAENRRLMELKKAQRLFEPIKNALDQIDNPEYIASDYLLLLAAENSGIAPTSLRRNTEDVMAKCGYEKLECNESKDGRWKFWGRKFYVYKKKGSKALSREALRKQIEWCE